MFLSEANLRTFRGSSVAKGGGNSYRLSNDFLSWTFIRNIKSRLAYRHIAVKGEAIFVKYIWRIISTYLSRYLLLPKCFLI